MNLVKHISIVVLLRKLKVRGPRSVNPGFLRAFYIQLRKVIFELSKYWHGN
jgi:hypothetical protein